MCRPKTSAVKLNTAKAWPWRSLLALVFALLGQRALEPSPNRTATVGWCCMASPRLAYPGLSAQRVDSRLLIRKPEPGSDTLRVRRLPLILAILLIGGGLPYPW